VKQFVIFTRKRTMWSEAAPSSDYAGARETFNKLLLAGEAAEDKGKEAEFHEIQLWDSSCGVRKRKRFNTAEELESIKKAKAAEAASTDKKKAKAAAKPE
jgi:hypothetical protein